MKLYLRDLHNLGTNKVHFTPGKESSIKKGTVFPLSAMKTVGGVEVQLQSFLTSGQVGVSG